MLANMPDGGTLILGVAENDGVFDVTGVWDPKAAQSALASKARERITPPLQLGAVEATIVEGNPSLLPLFLPSPQSIVPSELVSLARPTFVPATVTTTCHLRKSSFGR